MSESVSEANVVVLRFPVMFEVSGWVSDADRCVRRWVVPEVEADEAIIVYQAEGTWWPFRKFAWEVYAPYCNDALVEGTATSMEDAQRQADEALQQCVKLAAADVVSDVRVVEDAAHYQALYLAERRLRLAERTSSEALIKTGDSSPESLAALHEEAEARAALLRLGGEP